MDNNTIDSKKIKLEIGDEADKVQTDADTKKKVWAKVTVMLLMSVVLIATSVFAERFFKEPIPESVPVENDIEEKSGPEIPQETQETEETSGVEVEPQEEIKVEYGVLESMQYYYLNGIGYSSLLNIDAKQRYVVEQENTEQETQQKETVDPEQYAAGLQKKVQRYKKSINSDTVGWIYIPNSRIDYPVMQSDDNKYYLYRNIYKQYTAPKYYPAGSIFADYEVITGDRENMSWNTVLYGHNWYCHWEPARLTYPARSMFANLSSYRYSSFADTHRKIYFSSGEENMTFEVFAVFSAYTSFVDKYLIYPEMKSAKREYVISEALRRSEFDFGVEVSADDKIITLITCSWRYTNDGTGRYIVMGRLSEK